MKQKGFISIVVVLIIAITIGIGGYFVYNKKSQSPKSSYNPNIKFDHLVIPDSQIFLAPVINTNKEKDLTPNPEIIPNPTPTKSNETPDPVVIPDTIPTVDSIVVSLGEKFTLGKNQTAQIKNQNVSIKVTGFTYSPCPTGAQCIWSGLAVNYEITIDGKVVNNLYATPYNINVIKSDYKTYATYTITNAIDECIKQGGDGCLDALMRRFKDPKYCNMMTDPIGKGYCFDNLNKN